MNPLKKISGNSQDKINYVWALLRISLGWILLWAFLDKVFGLGFYRKMSNCEIRFIEY